MKYKIINMLLLVLTASADLYAEAFFAGSINSVNPDSGFNAMRNPALMRQQSEDTAGFFYFSSYDVYSSIKGDIKGIPGAEMEADTDEKFSGAVSFSYVERIKKSTIGIAVRKPEGTDQLLISENSFSISAPGISNTTMERKESNAVSAVFSIAGNLGMYETVGLQFEAGISRTTIDKDKFESGPPVKDYSVEITTDKVIGNLNAGYHFRSEDYEFGAILKFGEYNYEKQKYRYRDNLLFTENEKEVPSYLYRNRGFEYTLGLGYYITNRLFFNIEAALIIPFDSKKNELKDDDGGVMAEKNSRTYVRYSGQANGGFSYKLSRKIDLGIGAGAGIFRSDTTGTNGIKAGETSFTIYSMIAGAEIRAAEGVNILIGLNSYYYRSEMKAGLGPLSLEINSDSLYLNAIAGVSSHY